jgi:signal peptidase II
MKRSLSLGVLILILICIDQITKSIIKSRFIYGETLQVVPGFFNLAFVKNTGAAFGIGHGGPEWVRQIFFLALPVLFCIYVVSVMFKSFRGPLYLSVAYALILAGAVGNLIDRFTLGYVIDMFMFYWVKEENHFHVFNVADSCITIAAFLLIFDYFMQLKARKLQAKVN